MRVRRIPRDSPTHPSVELLDDRDQPIVAVAAFLQQLTARDYSPNTIAAYAYDLLHFTRFLQSQGLSYAQFTPPWSLRLLEYLRQVPRQGRRRRSAAVHRDARPEHAATLLAPATINRILAAVSSFYEYLILADSLPSGENPLRKIDDQARTRVGGRSRPFLAATTRQRPIRRAVRVKTIERLPRPLDPEQVTRLLGACRCLRDRAMLLLMLQGGLRPGEVLNLHLEDIQYGRRRIIVRCRTDHPKGVRTKSRTERVVDLHEPETLATISAYVMEERPHDTAAPHLFLIGGHGRRQHEPLGYDALVRLFRRQCARLGMNDVAVTPHALRHTHATAMYEAGMRELTLQKRLGHASPESTRQYTRVSDRDVLADYHRALREEAES